ncbi:hypothetical protein LEP1GSC170_5016 [Leptospira interrogans serovar Bataviae str. HAI135]|uniref:Uncharacterized protein n=1 Tax=Leptospira noguchii serovar Autumnalis str. ZUN142 TaxID=1085540 RepID=M6UGZ6_9LEPT|nr:hypothetical protein LEP1GSC170_5016 [Leptospira interrogans serovar Bataviae str. HAI135]EMO40374.1 hypothetical protein LEP1GSC186_3910 [Leptospira noguchii serovar Autumnalis str. ZUN142]
MKFASDSPQFSYVELTLRLTKLLQLTVSIKQKDGNSFFNNSIILTSPN